ncbi:ferredoxin family protein [bacterium]|nr:ferredoxin family protein [bacterium]
MTKRVVYCHCAYSELIPRAVRRRVLGGLVAADVSLVTVPDLCGLAARGDPLLAELAEGGAAIVACHPRAVRALFEAAECPLPEQGVELLNMKAQSADDILAAAVGSAPEPDEAATDAALDDILGRKDSWMPWFPAIDRERCRNCRQCLNFCLFGVYGVEGKKVVVQSPEKCKTYCPACARVCPDVAIIFPKFKDRPVDGDVVRDEDLESEKVGVEVADLVDGDVYAALRDRGKKRFAPDRDEALAERRRCVERAGLQAKLDIPDDVLDSVLGPKGRPDEEDPERD